MAQYLLLYSMSGDQEDLDVLVTPDGRYVRLACQGIDMGTRSFFELKRRTEEKAATLFEPPASYHVTGRSLLANRALNNIIRDMLVSFLSAFGIIFVAVTLLYRSIKAGLITMIPNIIPLVVTLGFMGLFGITLRVSTVVAFAICLGMAVDDTIHYLTRFREELDRTGDYITLHVHHTPDRGAGDRPDHLDARRRLPRVRVLRLQGHPRLRPPGQRCPHLFPSGLPPLSPRRIEHAEAVAGRG